MTVSIPTPVTLKKNAAARLASELEKLLGVIVAQLEVQWYGEPVVMVFETRNYPNVLGQDFDLVVGSMLKAGWSITRATVDTGCVVLSIEPRAISHDTDY
jgi:hypothetical protein